MKHRGLSGSLGGEASSSRSGLKVATEWLYKSIALLSQVIETLDSQDVPVRH